MKIISSEKWKNIQREKDWNSTSLAKFSLAFCIFVELSGSPDSKITRFLAIELSAIRQPRSGFRKRMRAVSMAAPTDL